MGGFSICVTMNYKFEVSVVRGADAGFYTVFKIAMFFCRKRNTTLLILLTEYRSLTTLSDFGLQDSRWVNLEYQLHGEKGVRGKEGCADESAERSYFRK